MPCMGPTHPSEAVVCEVTESVLEFLKQRYSVYPSGYYPLESAIDALGQPADAPISVMIQRQRSRDQLKAAIAAILFQDACETI